MVFAPTAEASFPEPSKLIGRLPGLTDPPTRPVLFPEEPRDTPCTGNPDARSLLMDLTPVLLSELELEQKTREIGDPNCRDWAISRLAAAALSDGRDLRPFERWAFLFAFRPGDWARRPTAAAHISLVVAEVLDRQGYLPEVEALLGRSERFGAQEAPFRAMAVANHLATEGRQDDADAVYSELTRVGFDPWIIYQASLGGALNALAHGKPDRVLRYVGRAAALLDRSGVYPGGLWVVGGETALAQGKTTRARQFYERAAQSELERVRALGLLRLADLELRAGRRESALRGWEMSEAIASPCLQEHVHLRRVLTLEENRLETTRYLQSQAQHSRCPSLKMESLYASALINIHRGQELDALSPARALLKGGYSRWGSTRPERAVFTITARSAVERFQRHRDPAALVQFFEVHLEDHAHLLDAPTRATVARAYIAIGAAARGARELRRLLTDFPKPARRRELILDFGRALLEAGDTYRTDLVLRYLQSKFGEEERLDYRYQTLAGDYALAVNRPAEALQHLTRARSAAPAGDRQGEIALKLIGPQLALGRVGPATRALSQALRAQHLNDSSLVPPAIRVLSTCIRECKKETLRGTLTQVVDRLGSDSLTPRLSARLKSRGLLPGDDRPPEKTLWSRLDSLEEGRGTEPFPKETKAQ